MLNQGHKIECHMYDLFGKDKADAPVPMGRAYATWVGDDGVHPPMILLEDLGDRARVLGDGSASLSFAQMLSVAEAQANLQAWCLTTEKNWKEKLETFEDRMAVFAAFVPMMQQAVQKAKEAYPEAFGKLDNTKLMRFFDLEGMKKFHFAYREYMPDVMVHGDFWANNIMFNKLPDGSMGNDLVAFIDWQLTFIGNPLMDLGRMLSMSFDSDLRNAHLEDIIKRYYECLQKKLGDKMPEGLTFERVLHMAHEQTAINCLMLFFMQDTMQSMFAPLDGPESEIKRDRMIKTTKKGLDYAAKFLDINVASDK